MKPIWIVVLVTVLHLGVAWVAANSQDTVPAPFEVAAETARP